MSAIDGRSRAATAWRRANPGGFGLPAGSAVTLEKVGDTVTMRAVVDPAEEERKLTQPIGQLRDIRKDVPRPVSDPED